MFGREFQSYTVHYSTSALYCENYFLLGHCQQLGSYVDKSSALTQGQGSQLANFAATHPSAKYVATVAETTSWCRLWDLALDRGVQGTCGMQSLLKNLVVKFLITFRADLVVPL